MKEPKNEICWIFLEIPETVTQSIYNAADCCSQRDRVTVMFSVLLYSVFTVQILYKLYSLQLNCTYSNYTEDAATCSAEQQFSISQADVLCCAVQQVVWYYTVTHIQRLNVIKKLNCLKTHCHNYTALSNSTVWSCTPTDTNFYTLM